MTKLKTSLLLLSALILLAAFAPAKKFLYDSSEGRFSVVFPAEYATERDEGEDVATIKTSCNLDGQTYFASYSLHQLEMTDPMEMAEVSYDSFIKAVGGVLQSKSDWKVKEHTGLIAVMNLSDESVLLEYRVILVGNIQYQLVVLAATGDYDAKAAGNFFDSFKLKD